MSDPKYVAHFKRWFQEYTSTFRMEDTAGQESIQLKITHTYGVCEAMEEITKSLQLTKEQTACAATIALFHDVGRFEQYRRYKTFKDAQSEDHAELGIRILREKQVLAPLPTPEQERVLTAIRWHNKMKLPDGIAPDTLLYCKLIRDADKVDIFRVVSEYYTGPEESNTDIELGLGPKSTITPEIARDFLNHKMIKITDLKTREDFKVLQLAWVHDLNFARTRELIYERDYLCKISSTLPAGPFKEQIIAQLHAYNQALPVTQKEN